MWHNKPRPGSMCAYWWARTSTYSLLKSWSTSWYMRKRKTVTAVNAWLLHNLFKIFYRCRQTLVLDKLSRTKQHNHQIYRTVGNMSKAYRPTGTIISITNYQQQQMDLSNLWPSLVRRIPATPSLMWHSLRDYVKLVTSLRRLDTFSAHSRTHFNKQQGRTLDENLHKQTTQ